VPGGFLLLSKHIGLETRALKRRMSLLTLLGSSPRLDSKHGLKRWS